MKLLYACENVRTTVHGAKLNLPPNAAFRAPGFVEGTFGLECLLDELAAKLELDPLRAAAAEPRRRRPRRRAAVLVEEPGRVLPARARRTGSGGTRCARAPRGRGSTASAWRARSGTAAAARPRTPGCGSARTAAPTVITAMQDIGTGTRTAMAQIAAEELGLPLERVDVALGDSARGPVRRRSRPARRPSRSMGPAVRAAAGDAARQLLELAAQRFDREQRMLSLRGGRIVCVRRRRAGRSRR